MISLCYLLYILIKELIVHKHACIEYYLWCARECARNFIYKMLLVRSLVLSHSRNAGPYHFYIFIMEQAKR